MTEGIYILHFSKAIIYKSPAIVKGFGGPFHYVGLSKKTDHRIMMHRTGHGASKTRIAVKQGIEFSETVLHIPATLDNESFVTKNVLAYCGVCQLLGEGEVVMETADGVRRWKNGVAAQGTRMSTPKLSEGKCEAGLDIWERGQHKIDDTSP